MALHLNKYAISSLNCQKNYVTSLAHTDMHKVDSV